MRQPDTFHTFVVFLAILKGIFWELSKVFRIYKPTVYTKIRREKYIIYAAEERNMLYKNHVHCITVVRKDAFSVATTQI